MLQKKGEQLTSYLMDITQMAKERSHILTDIQKEDQ